MEEAKEEMLKFDVRGKVVERVELLRKKQWAWRLDVWPFAILYGVWLSSIVPSNSIDAGDAAIVLGAFVGLHILVWLFTAWSVDFKCFAHYAKVVDDIHKADSCKITPPKFSGSKQLVLLHVNGNQDIYFDFRKQSFIYSEQNNTFTKLPYPTKETFGYYLKTTGHGTQSKLDAATDKWGRNVCVTYLLLCFALVFSLYIKKITSFSSFYLDLNIHSPHSRN